MNAAHRLHPAATYADAGLSTVGGPQVIVMCFDRIDRDLAVGIAAIASGDLSRANTVLIHAQDLFSELSLMVDQDAWEHAERLVDVYDFMLRELIAANVAKDASRVEGVRALASELGEAFRAAAAVVRAAPSPSGGSTAGAAGSSAGGSTGGSGRSSSPFAVASSPNPRALAFAGAGAGSSGGFDAKA
jgi:flagellar protein FliS